MLQFSLASPARVTAEVLDARGRRVREVPGAAFGAGEGALRLGLSGLAPGAYTVRLATPEASGAVPLTVVR
jgi:hypothetical protein